LVAGQASWIWAWSAGEYELDLADRTGATPAVGVVCDVAIEAAERAESPTR
jgi:hypothetical protein